MKFGAGPPCITDIAISSAPSLNVSSVRATVLSTGRPFEWKIRSFSCSSATAKKRKTYSVSDFTLE